MLSISFNEFKSYFEFAIKIASVLGAISTILYKLDVMKAFWKVA
jgi:hypothetical protein